MIPKYIYSRSLALPLVSISEYIFTVLPNRHLNPHQDHFVSLLSADKPFFETLSTDTMDTPLRISGFGMSVTSLAYTDKRIPFLMTRTLGDMIVDGPPVRSHGNSNTVYTCV